MLYATVGLLFAESAIALFKDFELPRPLVAVLYPQLDTLHAYCSTHVCLYDSNAVASLYAVQLITLVVFALLLSPVALSSKPPLPRVLTLGMTICLCGGFLDYLRGNFSFDPSWRYPNSVTESPAGLFRFAFIFSVSSLAMMILAHGGSELQVQPRLGPRVKVDPGSWPG
jgi:hypothetical protein